LLQQAMPFSRGTAAAIWAQPLSAACRTFEINQSLRRMAAFLGHVAHESEYLRVIEENLRYLHPQQLMKVYPSAFKTATDAAQYINNPEALANKVYADRMGNGDSASGEGWKYRGRGLIQLTGKDNYAALAKAISVDVVQKPDLVATPQYAALSAAWFWKKHRLNEMADAEHYETLSRRINKSLSSFPEREVKRKCALEALCAAVLVNIVMAARAPIV
jgi:putative chitinase